MRYTTVKSYRYRSADDDGERITKNFQAVRFGVQRNSTGGPFMVGMTGRTFNLSPSTYMGTSYHIDGGMPNDAAYIHAGNADKSMSHNTYIGCVGISGPGAFTSFKNTMRQLGFGSVGAPRFSTLLLYQH